LVGLDVKVWFSEKDVPLGTPLFRQIDKGLANSRAAIVLVTPALLDRIESEGTADKELSGLLATNRVIPLAHGTTFEALRDVSPLLASRRAVRPERESGYPVPAVPAVDELCDGIRVPIDRLLSSHLGRHRRVLASDEHPEDRNAFLHRTFDFPALPGRVEAVPAKQRDDAGTSLDPQPALRLPAIGPRLLD